MATTAGDRAVTSNTIGVEDAAVVEDVPVQRIDVKKRKRPEASGKAAGGAGKAERTWMDAMFGKEGESRTGGRKSIVVHHNRLDLRSDDPSELPNRSSLARCAPLDGGFRLSPFRHSVEVDSAAHDTSVSPPRLTVDFSDAAQPPRAAADTGDVADHAALEGDSLAPSSVTVPAAPVPLLRRSRESRPPDRFVA